MPFADVKLDGLRVSLEHEMRCEAHCSSPAFETNDHFFRISKVSSFSTKTVIFFPGI